MARGQKGKRRGIERGWLEGMVGGREGGREGGSCSLREAQLLKRDVGFEGKNLLFLVEL